MDNENIKEVTVNVTVDQALRLMEELNLEMFKARIALDGMRAHALSDDIKILEDAIKEAIRKQ